MQPPLGCQRSQRTTGARLSNQKICPKQRELATAAEEDGSTEKAHDENRTRAHTEGQSLLHRVHAFALSLSLSPPLSPCHFRSESTFN